MAMGQTISLFAASMIAETLIRKSSTCDQALDELYKNIPNSMARREGVIIYTIMLLANLNRPICEEFVAAHMNRIQKEEQAKDDIDAALKEKEKDMSDVSDIARKMIGDKPIETLHTYRDRMEKAMIDDEVAEQMSFTMNLLSIATTGKPAIADIIKLRESLPTKLAEINALIKEKEAADVN